MATATDDRLGELRRRIDSLDQKAQSGSAEAKAHMRRHLDTLRAHQESATASAESRSAAADAKIDELNTELEIAEHRLAAELAMDRMEFVSAVQAELREWDSHLDRMQAKAAAKGAEARAAAEERIRGLRRQRNDAEASLGDVRDANGEAWREDKQRVDSKLDELKREADDEQKE
ncbi:MAG TPA: hypothetical protein VHK22_09790 [Gaiellaceae bacterium]|jgi:hypothetical protein|nr:hypothetical protein [Gaiellaceae bacterium]